MEFLLPHHIGLCDCSGASIILDERRDRYFQLPDRAHRALNSLQAGEAADRSDVEALLTVGVLTRDPARGRSIERTAAAIPTTSAIDDPRKSGCGATLRVAAEVAAFLSHARFTLKTRKLSKNLEIVRRRDLGDGPGPSEETVAQFAQAFEAAQRRLPTNPSCLPRSLALLGFLARRGVPAMLVIGVKRFPFGAHCWVQNSNTLLNENYDVAQLYTPIRVVK